MEHRVTAEELREILSVARKLRIRARDETDEDFVDLFLRAAMALEQRARLLAFYPPADAAPDSESAAVIPLKPVNLIC